MIIKMILILTLWWQILPGPLTPAPSSQTGVSGDLCVLDVCLTQLPLLSPHTNESKPKAALSITAIVSCVTMGAL